MDDSYFLEGAGWGSEEGVYVCEQEGEELQFSGWTSVEPPRFVGSLH